MPRSYNLATIFKAGSIVEPRIAMQVLASVLLVANLVAAVFAFKPFGGSAEDLRKDQTRLTLELRQLRSRLEVTKDHVAKIKMAHSEGDQFLAKYIMDERTYSATMVGELPKAATDAGVRFLPENARPERIEGSDTLQMVTITAAFEGPYAGLAKLVNTLEKSDHFLIIDSMNLNAPQQQNVQRAAAGPQVVNISMKLLVFTRGEVGALP